jgi:hypothetical protein
MTSNCGRVFQSDSRFGCARARTAALAKMKSFIIAQGRRGLPPERLGEAVRTALTIARPKVRYSVTPKPFQSVLAATLPKRALDRMIARQLGLTPAE